MHHQDLHLLLGFNMERQLPLDEEWTLEESLENEKSYLEIIQGYANNTGFLKEAMSILKDDEVFEDVKLEVSFIILLSGDTPLIEELLSLVCKDNEITIPFDEKLSLLQEDQQKTVIKQLIAIDNKKSLSFAGKCIIANGYKEFVKAYYHGSNIVTTDDISVAYAVICRLGNNDEIALVKNAFTSCKHPILKEHIAQELVFAQSKTALAYLKNANNIDSFRISPFSLMQDEFDYYENQLIKELEHTNNEDIDGFMEAFSYTMLLYGNPKLIPFFIKLLKNQFICLSLHEILLNFFDEDDPRIEKGHDIIEQWEEIEESLEEKYMDYNEDDYAEKYTAEFNKEGIKIQKQIIAFWEKNQSYIQSEIDMKQRYFYDMPFSLPEVWDDAFDDGVKEEIELVHKGIQLFTGYFLSFDKNALVSKQIEQHQEIMRFFHKNADQYQVGQWYLWGSASK